MTENWKNGTGNGKHGASALRGFTRRIVSFQRSGPFRRRDVCAIGGRGTLRVSEQRVREKRIKQGIDEPVNGIRRCEKSFSIEFYARARTGIAKSV